MIHDDFAVKLRLSENVMVRGPVVIGSSLAALPNSVAGALTQLGATCSKKKAGKTLQFFPHVCHILPKCAKFYCTVSKIVGKLSTHVRHDKNMSDLKSKMHQHNSTVFNFFNDIQCIYIIYIFIIIYISSLFQFHKFLINSHNILMASEQYPSLSH